MRCSTRQREPLRCADQGHQQRQAKHHLVAVAFLSPQLPSHPHIRVRLVAGFLDREPLHMLLQIDDTRADWLHVVNRQVASSSRIPY